MIQKRYNPYLEEIAARQRSNGSGGRGTDAAAARERVSGDEPNRPTSEPPPKSERDVSKMNETAITRALTLSGSFVDRGVVLVETDDVEFLVAQGKQGQGRHLDLRVELLWRFGVGGCASRARNFEKNRLFTRER